MADRLSARDLWRKKMRAVLLPGDARVEVVERPTPSPGPNDVLVRVRASAICASDLSLYYGNPIVGGEIAAQGGQIVPGHEPAGEVVEVGANVERIKVGDRVLVHLSVGCWACEYCRAGYVHQCAEWKCIGFDLDGGDADYIVIPQQCAIHLPPELSYEAGALIVDNFGTQWHTQKRLGVSGVHTVAMIGIGPMGGAGVLLAKGLGARVIAVDVLEHRLDLARQLGADETVDASSDRALSQILELTRGRGVDIAIDCTGKDPGVNLALDAAAAFGKVGIVGECLQATVSPSNQMIRKELHVIGAWVFPIFEYEEIFRFVLDREVDIERTISDRVDITDAPDAFERFEKRLTEKVMFVWD
jgi:threonine dehydrogenase-like Zn-dependent dehydrogenase